LFVWPLWRPLPCHHKQFSRQLVYDSCSQTRSCCVTVVRIGHACSLADGSAGPTAEPNGSPVNVVQHLERPLLHVADDARGAVVAVGREGEAAFQEDPAGVEVHDSTTGEDERDGRSGDRGLAAEVEARVEEVSTARRRRILLHPVLERRGERRVRGRRQARDDGAGVHDRPGGEDRGRDIELRPIDLDALEPHAVERRELDADHRCPHEARRRARSAEREEPGGARGGREAVREGAAKRARRLRGERLRAAAEAHEPVGEAVEAPLLVAAPELEARERVGAHLQRVGAVRPGRRGAVAVRDDVLALGAGAAVALLLELRAGLRAAGEGGVGGRRGGVEDRVRLLVTLGARLAPHPRHVAAGVDEHVLGRGRGAEPDADHVLQRLQGCAQAGRHAGVRLLDATGFSGAGDLALDVASAELVALEHLLQCWHLLGVGGHRGTWAVAVAQRHRGAVSGRRDS
jgi:hypothetical protein